MDYDLMLTLGAVWDTSFADSAPRIIWVVYYHRPLDEPKVSAATTISLWAFAASISLLIDDCASVQGGVCSVCRHTVV